MENKVLNDKSFDVFVIIAETLEKWHNPASEAGKSVFLEHYSWGAELKAKNKLILAGPTNFELISTKKIDPIGHITGIIILNVSSREEAVEWAEKDPFHLHEFRRNNVQSLKISMTDNFILESLQKIKYE
jgi:uncharacterized protein YciI